MHIPRKTFGLLSLLILIIALIALLATPTHAQPLPRPTHLEMNTNTAPTLEAPAAAAVDTNAPPADSGGWWNSPVLGFLQNGSNWIAATYGIYDTTSKEFGGGVGVGYKISEYVVTVVRLDFIADRVFVPSGSLQLQLPINIGRFKLTPFGFSAIATSLNSDLSSGEPVGIFGAGGALTFNTDSQWYVPKGLIADFEHWTGGGFNDDQIRFGVLFKF